MTKKEILKRIKNVAPTPGRNSMGNSESWYNPYYLLSKCFTEEELVRMGVNELNNLVKLADFASDVFY